MRRRLWEGRVRVRRQWCRVTSNANCRLFLQKSIPHYFLPQAFTYILAFAAINLTSPPRHTHHLLHPLPLSLVHTTNNPNPHQSLHTESKANMRFLSLLATALLAASTHARSSIFGSSIDVAPYEDSLKVPGENPLQHCQDPKNDILELESVDLDPNPPVPCVDLISILLSTPHTNACCYAVEAKPSQSPPPAPSPKT